MHSAQCMPIKAAVETIILPPQKVPRLYTSAGQAIVTGAGIPENHALTIVADGACLVTLANAGDTPISLPFPPGYRRIIPIREILDVTVNAANGVRFTLWIEDLRAMEPWICDGALRP